jgi:hypothetical protein
LAAKPYGLGRDSSEVDALVREGAAKITAQAKAADPEKKPSAEIGSNQHTGAVDNVNGRPTGNSSDYLVRRSKRDAPAVAAALANVR